MILRFEGSRDPSSGAQFQLVALAVIKGKHVGIKAFVHANCQRGRRIKSAADQDDGAFHFASGNSAVTTASRGEQTRTKSSRMRFVTASLKARSFRNDAR